LKVLLTSLYVDKRWITQIFLHGQYTHRWSSLFDL